ncbi:MAG TPA: hypothetical protein VIF62_01255 [Labilithrix sp.]|jgi:hypothetical protein
MLPEPENDDVAYDSDEEPTLPRPRAQKISGVRPASPAEDSVFDDIEADTDVDGSALPKLPADDEPPTAHYPSDVEEMLVGISKMKGDDTITAVAVDKTKKGDRS